MAMNLREPTRTAGITSSIHTFPDTQERIYPDLLGAGSPFTGASLQMNWSAVHERTLRWVLASAQAKKPWVVANDEQGPAGLGVPPDPGYVGFAGKNVKGADVGYTLHDIRKSTLWGNLMAGGAGVDYYFGMGSPDNDLVAENFRSRDKSWDYGRIAIDFFRSHKIPFWEMANADALVGNDKHDNSRYCFAKANDAVSGVLAFRKHCEPRSFEGDRPVHCRPGSTRGRRALKKGSSRTVKGGAPADLGMPPDNPTEDWLVVVRRS